jgi:mono/diheme cytochrome c family protein
MRLAFRDRGKAAQPTGTVGPRRPVRWIPMSVLAAALAATALAASRATADDVVEARARLDYLLHCSGCHMQDGEGKPARGIPRLKDQVGYFLHLPEGREFLMQVPGLLSAGMSDARAAAVTNYMVRRFAGPSLPPQFVSYTPEEARRLRLSRPADITAKRQRLYGELVQMGFPIQ